MRQAFRRWGLPGSLRVDNGAPWGSRGEWPTALALWSIGLGIPMLWDRPRQPQENGVIERSQGTADRWCEPWACDSAEELQARLERMDRLYRAVSPYRDGRSRAASDPGLAHSGRVYAVESEATSWDWTRATAHLSSCIVIRQVDHRGFVPMYNWGPYVGKLHSGKSVSVMFDPESKEWVFADDKGQDLGRKAARELSPERVLALDVTRRR